MRDPFIIISMLNPGPKSPGKDIYVYFQPLIDELNELWEGVEACDAHKGEKFKLRAVLLWTINDFPAYVMLSGWSTKGHFACPVCMNDTFSEYLPFSRKLCYMGYRRFLSSNHQWRKDKKNFNGKIEIRGPVVPKSGYEILNEVQMLNDAMNFFGKSSEYVHLRKRKRNADGLYWTNKSVFCNLPYWVDLK
ncbi:hypothetical protein ACH5RR_026419 [Cinchona calisaya]|uniref:Uncharacterized protein n=1 Tax=Cinchona calisaya TaxID=153742 RepID=A0ABD2Z2I4_9GENT